MPPTPVGLWTAVGAILAVAAWLLCVRYEQSISAHHGIAQILATALLFALLAWRVDQTGLLLITSGFAVTAVPIAFIDAFTQRIPNWLVGSTYLMTLVFAVGVSIEQRSLDTALRALACAGVVLVFYGILYVFMPGQLGGGDVKLAVPAGFVLGWHSWSVMVFGTVLAWLCLAVVFLAIRVMCEPGKAAMAPLGPAIVAGAFAALLLPTS